MQNFIKKNLRKYLKFDILINNKIIFVEIIHKRKIKHCYLAIKSAENLQIRAHTNYTIDDAKKLIQKKENWLLKHITNFEKKSILKQNNYYLGEIIDGFTPENIDEFYKQKAKEIMPELVKKNSEIMQLYPSDLKFRKNKTRFGSCSYKNSISLNILLMKYPLDVIEYVIIHELAHIKHKNHSRKFWLFVEKYCPEFKKLDNDLKMF